MPLPINREDDNQPQGPPRPVFDNARDYILHQLLRVTRYDEVQIDMFFEPFVSAWNELMKRPPKGIAQRLTKSSNYWTRDSIVFNLEEGRGGTRMHVQNVAPVPPEWKRAYAAEESQVDVTNQTFVITNT